MSRYEQFGSINQNNHSEEVFWAAHTRKLKNRCSQERNNEKQTAILPAVLLELSVKDNENHANRCNLIKIPRSCSKPIVITNKVNLRP